MTIPDVSGGMYHAGLGEPSVARIASVNAWRALVGYCCTALLVASWAKSGSLWEWVSRPRGAGPRPTGSQSRTASASMTDKGIIILIDGI